MPKLKVHRGAHKRVKLSAKGKLIRRRAYGGHFLSKKRASRRRLFNKDQSFSASDIKNVKRKMGI